MSPVRASLRYPQVTVVLLAMLCAAGVYALLKMPRREDPKITIRMGLVIAYYPGATSELVENQVTRKVEDRLFRFAEVRKAKTYSTSRPSLMVVNVELEENVTRPDEFWSKLRHTMNELRQQELPPGVQGPIVDSDFGDTVAMLIALHGGGYDYRELKGYAERIQDEFRTVRAVSKLRIAGEQKEEIRISSSMDRVAQYAASPSKIIGALQGRNTVQYGGVVDTQDAAIPIAASGLFQTEEQIRRVMVDVSPSGQPVYIGDLADVQRLYVDPKTLTRYNGKRALLLTVEMLEGNNIVEFGDELRKRLAILRTQLPPDLQIDLIADQPEVVRQRISHFVREFGIAIGSVVLVTLLLLPLRVALIAAVAIPVTVATTFAVMNALRIELHQVSIASLIVVLGMVVDDAIVIADNYVELLDQGLPVEEAAWRSATDLTVPVLTATLTIIASFLPMLILAGAVGEFIAALPITVAVALLCSFAVAMLLTPVLCRVFIRHGLKSHGRPVSRFSPLALMSGLYGRAIRGAMRHKPVAILAGVGAIAGGVYLLRSVPERFFPTAERNQFVVDVWMPEGTRIERTDVVARRIEEFLAKQQLVRDYSVFLGASAPRFYYNVNPEFASANYAQLLVNTTSVEETPDFVYRLRKQLDSLAPEAMVMVKELQQGNILLGPVEIRLIGEDITVLKRLGRNVEDILRAIPGAEYVWNNYRDDAYQLRVQVKEEVANRLGLSNASIAMQLGGQFSGAPVTTYWEGNRDVRVVLRLSADHRRNFEDVEDTYVVSTITGASVPVRSVADVHPEWQSSRIVRRNGMRTLTVQAFHDQRHLASEILKTAAPALGRLELPTGYRLEFGGERQNQEETFSDMVRALLISLVLIFLILLFQFKSFVQTLLIMVSIPLALLGAGVGLVITSNPFSFTSFLGIISLSGVVVRNAIILVEHINDRRAAGTELTEAALEAGERRLRPIFLTTAAAAVGVTPMIISGSSLWSPLASVIAVGLLFSMVFTLIVIPVLYVLIERRSVRTGPVAMLVLLMMLAPSGVQARNITLDEAISLALKGNAVVKVARLKVTENAHRAGAARANYFPQVTTDANLWRVSERQSLAIPAGSLGVLPQIGAVPSQSVTVFQGLSTLAFATTTAAQPITQLWKIREADRAARQDVRIATHDSRRAENEIALKVQEAYYGVLILQAHQKAIAAQIAAAEARQREAGEGVAAGALLDVRRLEAETRVIQLRNNALGVNFQIAEVRGELNDLLGLSLDEQLVLSSPDAPPPAATPLDELRAEAAKSNPEIGAAVDLLAKARHGAAAARADRIPELSLFAQHIYQDGVPFLPRNNGVFGAKLNWSVFDGGKKRSAIGEREAQFAQAEENLRRVRQRVALDVEKALHKVEKSRDLAKVAARAVALRQEALRIARDQAELGAATPAAAAEASAALAEAEAQLLEAEFYSRVSQAELYRSIGRRP
jgi:multidrug efflux pump subunit AcrB/outer membrane protein TolC